MTKRHKSTPKRSRIKHVNKMLSSKNFTKKLSLSWSHIHVFRRNFAREMATNFLTYDATSQTTAGSYSALLGSRRACCCDSGRWDAEGWQRCWQMKPRPPGCCSDWPSAATCQYDVMTWRGDAHRQCAGLPSQQHTQLRPWLRLGLGPRSYGTISSMSRALKTDMI